MPHTRSDVEKYLPDGKSVAELSDEQVRIVFEKIVEYELPETQTSTIRATSCCKAR